MTKRIKPKWQLEKEQNKKSKRDAFDSITDFANSIKKVKEMLSIL